MYCDEQISASQVDLDFTRALRVPEIVLSVQKCLPVGSLLATLRVSHLWYNVGHTLLWHTIHWENTRQTGTDSGLPSIHDQRLLLHAHHIRVLHCMFHSQDKVSSIDTSVILNSFVDSSPLEPAQRQARIPHQGPADQLCIPRPRKQLEQLFLKGHFDLQLSSASISTSPLPSNEFSYSSLLQRPLPTRLFSFNIPSLLRLEIQASSNTPVDIHVILEHAIFLKHLIIQSHGSFLDSQTSKPIHNNNNNEHNQRIHDNLQSLKIQYLNINQQQLAGIASRCPNLKEFHSLSSPSNFWKQRPVFLTTPQSGQGSQPLLLTQSPMSPQRSHEEMSLVHKLAQSCPQLTRLHVGHQQGGFHLDSIQEALTLFPNLTAFGMPALDCSKTTMETIKSLQMRRYSASLGKQQTKTKSVSSEPMFLTKLTLLNVSSSERISQAIHDYMCWTPYLKEFYAYNTTLYLDQMQNSVEPMERVVVATTNNATNHKSVHEPSRKQGSVPKGLLANSNPSRRDNGNTSNTHTRRNMLLEHSDAETIVIPVEKHHGQDLPTSSLRVVHQNRLPERGRFWACTNLETLVVRFARAPWQSLSEPPRKSRDTFRFMSRLQKLNRLCIKEGLVLDTGREYDALSELRGLEQVVFTTCYPVPIKPVDMMAWIEPDRSDKKEQENENEKKKEKSKLQRVAIRRQKQNTGSDQEMEQWFREHQPYIQFSFEVTDCCEDEFSFSCLERS